MNPQTGKQLWMIDVFGTFPQRAVGSPVIAGDLIIGNSGARAGDKNLVAVRPKTTSGGIEVEEAYRVSKTAPHVPTPLVHGKWVFLWNDSGVVTCITAEGGKKVWQKRVGGAYFSSPACIDGKLYCADLEGTVVVLATSDQYEVLARNPLGETSHATPAVSNGTLFIRTNSQLFAIGGK